MKTAGAEPAVRAAAAERTATADLRLRKASDLAAQLTSTEWLNSMPGTAEQKLPLICITATGGATRWSTPPSCAAPPRVRQITL